MKRRKFPSVLAATIVGVFILSGCEKVQSDSNQLSEEAKSSILDACSPVFNLDWQTVDDDLAREMSRDFTEKANRAVGVGDPAKTVVADLSTEVSNIRENYAQFSRDFNGLNLLDKDDQEQAEEAVAIMESTREKIANRINTICAPYFSE